MKTAVVLIPALNPDDRFIAYARELHENGFRLIIVDDGSREDRAYIFEEITKQTGASLLRHAVNLGKGRALKNGFNLFLNEYAKEEDVSGIITADSDGQHAVKDILRMEERIRQGEGVFVLGCRSFDLEHVPWKSRFGNKMTRMVMKLLHGLDVEDTQTGLRGMSKDLVPSFIELYGERFEYETNMLIEAAHRGIAVRELPIETIYIDENRETHFQPLRDSAAIYRLILGTFMKYICSSIGAFVIDIGMFQILLWAMGFASPLGGERKILYATAGARVVSSFCNYLINRNIVFQSAQSRKATFVKYYLLCAVQMLCSACGVILLNHGLHLHAVLAKCIVDTLLFFISFRIQRNYVFGRED